MSDGDFGAMHETAVLAYKRQDDAFTNKCGANRSWQRGTVFTHRSSNLSSTIPRLTMNFGDSCSLDRRLEADGNEKK